MLQFIGVLIAIHHVTSVKASISRNFLRVQENPKAAATVVLPCFSGGGLGNWGVEIATSAIYAEVTGATELWLPTKKCDTEPDEWSNAERHEAIRQAMKEHQEAQLSANGGALVSQFLEPFAKLFPKLPLALPIRASTQRNVSESQKQAMVAGDTSSFLQEMSAKLSAVANADCECCNDFWDFSCGGRLKGDDLAQATHQYLGPYISCPAPASDITDKTLVLHVRRQPEESNARRAPAEVHKDDVYFVSDECYYPQPPCAYYEDIIDRGRWENVIVIESPGSGDEKNTGCANHLVEKYAKTNQTRMRLQKASLREDACTMHHANNIALSFSSFSTLFGLYVGLPEKRNSFFPFASGSLQLGHLEEDSPIRYNAEMLAFHQPKSPLTQTLYAFPEFACTANPEYQYNLMKAMLDYPKSLLKASSSV